MVKNIFEHFKPHCIFAGIALIFWSVSRSFFVFFLYHERSQDTGGITTVLVQGFRFDTITVATLLIIPVLLTCFFSSSKKLLPVVDGFLKMYFAIALFAIILMELSTPTFIQQYDTRPNMLFVEYLKYPAEVVSMLTKGFLLPVIITLLLTPMLAYMSVRGIAASFVQSRAPLRIPVAVAVLPCMLVFLVLCVRSSFGHRPANPSNVAFSNDLMVNSLGLNSSYSLLYAVYANQRNAKNAFNYGYMAPEVALKKVIESTHLAPQEFTDATIPTLHYQDDSVEKTSPLNFVIILEESLGAEYVAKLGGKALTPELEKLAAEGIWFDNMYATGTRSVRGIEAVTTGFVPNPTLSVVKREASQSHFFTIASLLTREGYDTSFIYGGQAHFDNMRRFFVGNGFEKIIEQKDFEQPSFVSSWGVSDEDLLNKAHAFFFEPHKKPFFSLVFTSSNHEPYEIPAGRVAEGAAPNERAVQYTDYALGQFFEKAKASDYWKNTVFLVVADHNSRVFGRKLVPIERFHIPALLLGGTISPRVHTPIASQIDIIPTVLPLLGIHAEHPAIGLNVFSAENAGYKGRAIMQYNDTQAFMEGDSVVILQRDKTPEMYLYQQGNLTRDTHENSPENTALIEKALAHSVWGNTTFNRGEYRLPLDAKNSKAPTVAHQ